jgi:hypothetical protein
MTFIRSLRAYAANPRRSGPPGGAGAQRQAAQERCEICSTPLPGEHPHVLEYATRSLLCSCHPCARLFVDARASSQRFRTIPDRVLANALASVDETRWRAVGIPVGLAFVVRDSHSGAARCIYPSPAGPVESEIDADGWSALTSLVALADAAEPDVEAILFRRRHGGSLDVFVAPLDACYAIVGAVRATWRGFDGGDEARRVIQQHVDHLLARSCPAQNGADQ